MTVARRVLIAHHGEYSPVDPGYRAQRYGQLARQLVADGHSVVRLLPLHRHLSDEERPQLHASLPGEGELVHMDTVPYATVRGPSRIRFLRSYCRALEEYMEAHGHDVDLAVIGCPPLHQRPAIDALRRVNPQAVVVVDVRDLWPDAQIATGGRALRALLTAAKPVLRRRAAALVDGADKVSAVSASYLDWARQLSSCPAQEMAVVGIGAIAVDRELWNHVPPPGPGDRQQVLFVGSFSPHFDFRGLIDAWAALVDRQLVSPTPELLLIGDGPTFEATKPLLAAHPTIRAVGRLAPSEVPGALRAASVGVAPYARTSIMSSTNKIAEYASAGLPIVCTGPGASMPSLVESGLMTIADAGDVDAYADALAAALRRAAEPETRGEVLRVFDEELSERAVTRRFIEFILSGGGRREEVTMPVPDTLERPTRGAVRLVDHSFDVSSLRTKLQGLSQVGWRDLDYGTDWQHVQLLKPDGNGGLERHDLLDQLPEVDTILESIPGPCMDLTIARLGPGGRVKTHRDISGGVPMGVARFHFPVLTNDRVEFQVSGERVTMREGETWNLDTSYPHAVANNGDTERIHLIGDFRMTDEVKAMLPSVDMRDRAHRVYFIGVCAGHGLRSAIKRPKYAFRRGRAFVQLRVFKKSQLVFDDE